MESDNTELLEQFRQILEHSQATPRLTPDLPDLYTLLNEMASLKTEVKNETRQFKNALDTLNQTVEQLENNSQQLNTELERHEQQAAQSKEEAIRELLSDVIDIYERMLNSQNALEQYQPVNTLFNHSKAQDIGFITSLREGQSIMIRRFEQLLKNYQVVPVDCVGLPLNPNTMNAVETGHDPQKAHGIVLEELRKGFLYKNNLLRLAEVKVNKITS